MDTIGERIKALRISKGLSAQTLGEVIGRSKSNISGYETGKYEPSAQTIVSLCDYFQVSADWLLHCKAVQKSEQEDSALDEDEADLLTMYRALDEDGKDDVFGLAQLKYERNSSGKKGSTCSTYTGANGNNESDPDEDNKASTGIA